MKAPKDRCGKALRVGDSVRDLGALPRTPRYGKVGTVTRADKGKIGVRVLWEGDAADVPYTSFLLTRQ